MDSTVGEFCSRICMLVCLMHLSFSLACSNPHPNVNEVEGIEQQTFEEQNTERATGSTDSEDG